MDEVDFAIALHTTPATNAGAFQIGEGPLNANSMGVEVEFFGRSAHACQQAKGVDAIRMAVEAYTGYQFMVAREIPPTQPCMINVGTFHGGNTNNIICDYVKMFLSARTRDDEIADIVLKRIKEISEGVASMCGGEAKVTVKKYLLKGLIAR
jgi:metal-dependent amidase/aminoacylase/carboxypeptidase family protein